MKKLFLLFFLLPFTFVGHAQTYDQYWSEIAAAERKDLPRTALSAVNEVRRKALREGNRVQLLKSLLAGRVYGGMISPDSAEVSLQLLRQGLREERDSVGLALWHNALAQIFAASFEPDSARAHFLASLRPAEGLARTSSSDYLPLLKAGHPAMAHSDNLLSVVYHAYLETALCETPEAESLLRRLAAVYERNGNRAAAMTCRLERISRLHGERRRVESLKEDTLFRALTETIERYGDLPQTVAAYRMLNEFADGRDEPSPDRRANDSLLLALTEAGIKRYGGKEANELRNFAMLLQAPSARLGAFAPLYLPSETARLTLTARHTERLSLRLTRIADSAAEYFRLDRPDAAKLAARSKEIVLNRSLSLPKRPAYEWQRDTIEVRMPDRPGVYAVQLWMDGRAAETDVVKVSDIRPLVFSSAQGKNRITVLHSRSGLPVGGAKVTAYDINQKRQVKVYTADKDGIINIDVQAQTSGERLIYFARTTEDGGSDGFTLSNVRHYSSSNPRPVDRIDLFTDRAVYRPGQAVDFSLTAYRREGDDRRTLAGLEGRATLYDVNRRAVDSLLVKTDTLGTASGRFHLPEALLPGYWYIEFRAGGLKSSRHLRIESYKRPTFTAETLPVRTAYSPGDTVAVEGTAKTYSGIPVAGAKVSYETGRYAWFSPSYNDSKAVGTTVTDDEGRFVLPVPLFIRPAERNDRFARFTYTVRYTVTAENGETFEGSATLRAAVAPARLETNAGATLCKERLQPWTVSQLNASGARMEAAIDYALLREGKRVAEGTIAADRPFLPEGLATMASGRYTLRLQSRTPGVPVDTTAFVLMSERDTRPADRRDPFYTYVRTSESGDSVFALAGSPEKDALLFYDLLVGDSLIESRRFLLSDTLQAFRLAYRPEYGDGAKAYVALVRNGRLYHTEWSVKRPEPCKRLKLTWTSFRDLLTPGGHEEWTLRITHPDGTPARANLLALLYDRSLDAFGRHAAAFSDLSFTRILPYASVEWRDYRPEWNGRTLYAFGKVNYLPTTLPEITRWNTDLFRTFSLRNDFFGLVPGVKRPMASLAGGGLKESYSLKRSVKSEAAQDMAAAPRAEVEREENGTTGESVSPRTNFAETAFFMPRLRTDEKGEVSLAFTLPESMTSWRLLALAHDRTMNYGALDTVVTARKDFTVETAAPRFLRKGDACEIPVKVTNLSDRAVEANVNLRLSETVKGDELLFDEGRTLTLAAGESRTLSYIYKVQTDAPAVVCRAVGKSEAFSDGEERWLAVLGDEVEVVRTLPFSLDRTGTTSLRVDTLFPKQAQDRALTVELASRPAWVAVTALPALSGTERSLSATEWGERYYALALGEETARQRPEIKRLALQDDGEADRLAAIKLDEMTELTPWLREAKAEAERGRALRALFDPATAAARRKTALERLAALQRADGSWSWYPGMPGNSYITLEVATLLARVQKLAAAKEVDRLFLPALDFLKGEIKKEVEEMKRTEKREKQAARPTELQLGYLYLRTLLGLRPDGDAQYLIARIKNTRNEVGLYEKALSAIILAHGGEEDEARETIKSLLEYTVRHAETGRYFDAPRAERTSTAYRVPTQCAAIEALEYFGRNKEADEMRLWLLQAKRTQMWETSRASADAVYTLLTARDDEARTLSLEAERPVYYTLYKGRNAVGVNADRETQTPTTAAYFKQTYRDSPATEADRLVLHKTNEGLAWGSVYAAFTVPASEVKTEGRGLQLSVGTELYRDGKWQPLTEGCAVEKGARLRRVFTLTADRDYDFVSVEAQRAACLQPAAPLSGYRYENGLSFYRSLTDSRTDFHIERVAKGAHRLTEEYFVDRNGVYHSGTAKVACLYAPEFAATAAESVITVE